jgi:RNA polymerase sigma-70 factor (ECF subfamily)
MAIHNILAERIRGGDTEAFKEVYMQHFHKVRYYAMQYLNSAEEAKDIAQEAFLELWNKRQNINPSLSITSYLLTIARNKCLNTLRSNLSSKKYESYVANRKADLYHSALLNHSAETLISSELESKIRSSIDKLPAKTKEVFLLSRKSELPYVKIAEQMGVSVKMVEYRMIQALRFLRTQLKEYLPIVVIAVLSSW